MAYPKHAEKAAAKRGTVSTKEFSKSAKGLAIEAATMTPAFKALKLAQLALKAAKKAGNAKKIAALQKKVKKAADKHNKEFEAKAKATGPSAKEQKLAESKGYYRPPRNPSEAAGGMK